MSKGRCGRGMIVARCSEGPWEGNWHLSPTTVTSAAVYRYKAGPRCTFRKACLRSQSADRLNNIFICLFSYHLVIDVLVLFNSVIQQVLYLCEHLPNPLAGRYMQRLP